MDIPSLARDPSIQALIDAFSESVAITDRAGVILAINRGWRQFGDRNGLRANAHCLHENYVAALDTDDFGGEVRRGFDEVAAGVRSVFEVEYPCHSDTEKRWFLLAITRFPYRDDFFLLVSHKDVTFIKNHERALEKVLFQTIDAIGSTIEKKDPYTSGHQRSVALLSACMGTKLGLSPRAVVGLWFGALIHDVGKIYVPAEVLNRPGRLSRVELDFIKEHAEVGYEIVHHIEFPWPVAEIVRQHHERIDGTGYPQGLRGDEIIVEARIVSVADVFEAMMSHRPYRAALGKDVSIQELRRGRGVAYDPDAVDACLEIVSADDFDISALEPPFDLS